MKTIYVDMDGVLSDFDKHYHDMFGVLPRQVRETKVKGQYTEYWNKIIDARGFANLPLFPGAEELVSYLNTLDRKKVNICILTSSGGFDRHVDVQDQKLYWLAYYKMKFPAVVVPGRRFKSGFADDRSFLIDDTLSNIEEFIAAGGEAVQHTNASVTISKLKEWLSKGG